MEIEDIMTLRLGGGRCSGRTHALIEGLKNIDRPISLLVHNHAEGERLKKEANNNPNINIVLFSDCNQRLLGTTRPVIADHLLWEDCIDYLYSEVVRLKKELRKK